MQGEVGKENTKQDDLLHVAKAYLGSSLSENVVLKWQKAKEGTKQVSTDRRRRNEARAKVLQRTPYPIVVNRIRTLIGKIQETQTTASPVSTSKNSPRLAQTCSPRIVKTQTLVPSSSPRSTSEPLSSSRTSHQAYIDELLLALKHVSKFLRQVPDESIRELCLVIKEENIKREEILFNFGDLADKFYIVLTGILEVTQKLIANDCKEKSVIANLKKGHAFGDTAILNNKPRNATCIAVSNCTVLTVERDEFLAILGPFFFGQKREIVAFLKNNVSVFTDVSRDICLSLMAFMMKLDYPADKEWDIHREKHIYFIRRGFCALYLSENQSARSSLRSRGQVTSSKTEGSPLDQVEIIDGQAIGTLGQHRGRSTRKKHVLSQKELVTLTAGDWFGGGSSLIGDGEVQRQLRVYSKTEIVAFVIPLEDFLTYSDPEIIRRLREDACFRMTYYVGRKGLVKATDSIGHQSVSQTSIAKHKNDLLPQKRTKRVEHQLTRERMEQCGFSPEVDRVLEHLKETKELNDKEIKEARYDCGTPTERYWSDPSLTRGVAYRRLVPLLEGIYLKGYTPLSRKLDRLLKRKQRGKSHKNMNSNDEQAVIGGLHSIDESSEERSSVRQTDLIAAAVLWERRRPPTPGVRQCLTYAEVIRNKTIMFE